jgi:hypothetical protein
MAAQPQQQHAGGAAPPRPPPAAAAGKLATWARVPQSRVALLVGLGCALGALPVWMHSRAPKGVENPYAAAKLRERRERYAWYESDDMPSK